MTKSIFILTLVSIFFIFGSKMSRNCFAQVTTGDSLALIALYDSTDGENWTDNTNWLSEEDVSMWYGITVVNNHVSELYIPSNNLRGSIPPEIGDLDSLSNFSLSNNQLTGSIPPEIYNLANLTFFSLSNNQLAGNISTQIGNLSKLEHLFLNNNQLTDTIPSIIGTLDHLIDLNLRQNQLSGTIPADLGNLLNLSYLNFLDNQLTGTIPENLSNMTNINFMYLNTNQLTGSIPSDFENLTNLLVLYLNDNQLSGPIPLFLTNMTHLIHLSIGNNQFTGPIPPELGNLTNLLVLVLGGNQLTGTIPSEIFGLSKLTALHLSGNQLTGIVPVAINNLNQLTYFYIDDNQFTELPALDSLTSLIGLKVENNKFTFEDLEPNIGLASSFFTYSPQDSVGIKNDTTLSLGDPFTISVSIGGTENQYQWMKDGTDIAGADSNTYIKDPLAVSDAGSYVCRITNSIATELTLYSRPVNLLVNDPAAVSENFSQKPTVFRLHQNHPNPFNPKTIINYEIPITSFVDVSVYTLLGQKVATLVSKKQTAGKYHTDWNAVEFASGVYVYRIEAGEFQDVKKMILLR